MSWCSRRMRDAVPVYVPLLVLFLCGSARGVELKVMSFNILHGGTVLGQPLSKTAEVITASGADLIGLQEQSGSTAALANLLGFHHYVQDNDISFLSRFPITRAMSSGIEVELPFGQPAYLFNVHLAPYPYQPYDIRDGLIGNEADAIARAETARGAAMSQTLQAMSPYLQAGDPVFLVGDFNEPSHLDWTAAAADAGQNFGRQVAWPASTKAELAGLTDTFRSIYSDPVERRGDTWTPLDAPGEVHDRIDIVYHAGDIVEPLNSQIVGESGTFADLVVTPYPSDHRAVVGHYSLSGVGGLTVRVDRGRGLVVVSNTSPEPITFDGYTLASPSGHLVAGDDGWRSLTDQGFDGWQEANPTTSRLSELNPLVAVTLAPNEAITLGRPYEFRPAVLGQPYAQDLQFRYFVPSGETLSAIVEFHGWRNELVLLVDPETGDAVLENQSPFDLPLDGYRISSSGGSLRPDDGAWISLSDRAIDTWAEANPSTNMLAELNPFEAEVLGAGARIRLGKLLDPLADLDLAFEFLMDDEAFMRAGLVIYEPFSTGCPEGDANGDCQVDLVDLNEVRNLFGSSGIGLAGDVDFDGRVDLLDLITVRNHFGEAGPFAVPEPSTWLMLAVGLCGLVLQRFGRQAVVPLQVLIASILFAMVVLPIACLAADAMDRLTPQRLAATHQAVLKLKTERRELTRVGALRDFRANLHVHSALSHDSRGTVEEIVGAAKVVGTQVILFTEHPANHYDFFQDGHRGLQDGVLLIPGAEMKGLLVFPRQSVQGLDSVLVQEFAHLVQRGGGLTFLSHLEERSDWDLDGLTGNEIYNTHADFKDETRLAAQLRNPLALLDIAERARQYPQETYSALQDYPAEYLRRWDQLCARAPHTGVAANDAHQNIGLTVRLAEGGQAQVEDALGEKLLELDVAAFANWLPAPKTDAEAGSVLIQLRLDPYECSLRHVGTHLLMPELTEAAVWEALEAGRAFVAFDWIADSTGFDVSIMSEGERFEMGSRVPLREKLKLISQAPLPGRWKLFCNGSLASESSGSTLEAAIQDPGRYRVEVWLDVAGEERLWIVSNPLYVTAD